MNDDFAVRINHVSKTFKLPHEKQGSIKGLFLNLLRLNKTFEKQHVLKDISFEIKKGEFFGIVGRNGSGKSTLLKLIAGIYSPDKGNIEVNGKLTPFIELGVGFNPELTGRENVYLNGALLGFNRKEVEAMYQDIVDFAEIEKFMDQKLKNYSSGMQVRLAFSIAIQAKSEILVLDEVLAVGDEAFQQKCISIFEQYKAQKQTIILVTHDMGVVERFCSRAVMLKDGEVVKMGTPRAVAQMYSDANKDAYIVQKQQNEAKKAETPGFDIKILDPKTQQQKRRFKQGERALVRLSWELSDVENAGVALMKQSGEYIFGPNTIKEKISLKGFRTIDYEVDLNVAAGEYYFKAGLFGKTAKQVAGFIDEGPSLLVEAAKDNAWGGVTSLMHSWKLGDKK